MSTIANYNFQTGRIHSVLFKTLYKKRQILRIAAKPRLISHDQHRIGRIKGGLLLKKSASFFEKEAD